jgi:hypothetical protein
VPAGAVGAGSPVGKAGVAVVEGGAVVVPTTAGDPPAVRRIVAETAEVEPAAVGVGLAAAGAAVVVVRAGRGGAAAQAGVAAVEGVGRSAAARVGDRRE